MTQRPTQQPLEDRILLLLKQSRRRLNRRTLAEQLDLRGQERKQLTRILNQLVRKKVLDERKGLYRLTPQQKLVVGTFSKAEKGYGFLRPDDPELDDLYIPARAVGSAMDGDRIEGSCHFSPRQGRPFARIHKIVERAHKQLIGTYQSRRDAAEVWPLNRSLGGPILVKSRANIVNGDVVNVEIDQYINGPRPGRGRIIEHLGSSDDPLIDIESVIRQHDLPHRFSVESLAQAERLAQNVSSEDIADRTDLRDLPLITIDGESAKDFDDAVAVRQERKDRYRLWVCIADVSHYVEPESCIDNEALERGTSVYFPGTCLPMLPEALSNGICSLNPDEDRLVMTAEMLIDDGGTTLESTFYPAVMRSHARLTYTEVAANLKPRITSDLTSEMQQQLKIMAKLAKNLSAMRQKRGSLDLDLPEADIVLDQDGRPVDLKKLQRTEAHRLIEEFMLAANEAVAHFLTRSGRPMLYRIHEQPDISKLQDLQQLAAQFGIGMILGSNLQRSLQDLLEAVKDKPEARMIQQHLLRSLQQACYAPENRGHFGLAASHYCHFTSPIRRYPDLAVHRVLKQTLKQRKNTQPAGKKLQRLAQDCSDKERRAMQAERDLLELRSCQVMADHVGESYRGSIASVTEFGFFVELDDLFVDGLVHIRSLNDYFQFDPTTMALTGERSRQSYRAGMRVRVRVKQVELWRRRIDFTLAEVLE